MYKVVTIITPLQYATKLNKALDRFNADKTDELTNLDSGILQSLQEANKGMRNGTLMKAVRNRIFADRFTRSLNRLIEMGYIVRTEYKKFVYYSITMEGRKAIENINGHMLAILNGK